MNLVKAVLSSSVYIAVDFETCLTKKRKKVFSDTSQNMSVIGFKHDLWGYNKIMTLTSFLKMLIFTTWKNRVKNTEIDKDCIPCAVHY